GAGGEAHRRALADLERVRDDTAARRAAIEQRLAESSAENARCGLLVRTADGREKVLALADVVRAYPANRLSFLDRAGIWLDRWREYLTEDPRESNTEGGVWPAIVGTVLMTLLMSVLVVPFGVLAALYLREYA